MRKVEVIVYLPGDISEDDFDRARQALEDACWQVIERPVFVQANEVE